MASLALTDRQRQDLHASILDYLMQSPDKFVESIQHFKREAGVGEIETGKGLLEKKWTAVVRLQKRVQDLEAQVTQLQQSRSLGDGGATDGVIGAAKDGSESSRMLPRAPAKFQLEGHRSPVTVVACHPVFSLCASGSEDNTIRLWDHETGSYERTLKGHTGYVTGLAFDPRGTVLASSSLDMSAKLWDMTTFTCTKTLRGHEHTISAIKFSLSGDHVFTCSRDATIKMWEVSTGYCTRTFNGHGDWVKTIAVSLDGNHIASGSSDQSIIVWQISTAQPLQTLRGHEHVIESVAFGKKPHEITNTSSSTAAGGTSSNEQQVCHENAPHVGVIAMLTHVCLCTQEDFSYLASASRDRTVKLWDALKGICLMTFTAHENWVRCVLFHPSGKYLISCSDDKSIRVLDIKEQRCLRTIPDAHEHFVTSMAMSNKYPVLVSGSVDKKLCVWHCS